MLSHSTVTQRQIFGLSLDCHSETKLNPVRYKYLFCMFDFFSVLVLSHCCSIHTNYFEIWVLSFCHPNSNLKSSTNGWSNCFHISRNTYNFFYICSLLYLFYLISFVFGPFNLFSYVFFFSLNSVTQFPVSALCCWISSLSQARLINEFSF